MSKRNYYFEEEDFDPEYEARKLRDKEKSAQRRVKDPRQYDLFEPKR